jgi:sugar phosphate isomerase/epimerase
MTVASLPPSGIHSFFGFEMPLAERARRIAEAGFTRSSLWWGPPEQLALQGRLDDGPPELRAAGLEVENLHVPFQAANDLWSPQPKIRRRFLDEHLAAVDACRRHGVERLVMHLSFGVDLDGANEAGLATFGKLLEHAERAGVVLAVENTRRDDLVHAVFERFDSPAVGLCYDVGHDWLWGTPRLGLLRRWAHRLVQTHICDVDGGRDRHMLPGDGVVDWEAVGRYVPGRIRESGLTLEIMPRRLEGFDGPDGLLAEAARRLTDLRQRWRAAAGPEGV